MPSKDKDVHRAKNTDELEFNYYRQSPMERFLGELYDDHVANIAPSTTTEDDSWSTAAVADNEDLEQR